jgi:hypothetical protein
MRDVKPEHKATLEKYTATHNGKALDQKKLPKPDTLITKTLIARFMSMTPEERSGLKGILTPESIKPLKVIIPEMSGIFDRMYKIGQRKMRNG